MKKKTYQLGIYRAVALFMAIALCVPTGCSNVEANESISAAALTRGIIIEWPEPQEATDESDKEVEEVYQEDTTEYGNTVGNLYNDGVFLADKEQGKFYFFNSYENAFCETDRETGNTKTITNDLIVYLQSKDGMLYGVQADVTGDNSNLVSINKDSGDISVLREAPPQYLQLADGIFYFTDFKENNLHKLAIGGGEEEVLLNEVIYYPVVYKDWIFFQMDSDNESLYRMPKDGGEPEKLNNVQSYCPLVYKDRVYYTTQDGNTFTISSMNIDGSDEQVILETQTYSLNLYDGRLYFVEEGNEDVISYIDLEDETKEKQTLDLEDCIKEAVKKTYGELKNYEVTAYSKLNFSDGCMLFMVNEKIEGEDCQDIFIYDMGKDEIIIIPDFCKTETEKANETVKVGNDTTANEETNNTGEEETPAPQNTPAPATSSKDAEARAVAQAIADSIPPGSDLERVSAAAAAVAGYCNRGVYTTDDPDYRTAYGVFCKGVYTCAGATRAMGMVLECMGYKWTHVNPNMWTHQWCQVVMDGQLGYADGQGGIAGYGKHPMQTD